MTRIYRYVLMNDTGMAPHIKRGILSLATCKPQLRQTAREGDWVLGCFPSPQNERIAWAGVIAKCEPVGEYGHTHAWRDDALYPYGPDGNPTRRPDKLVWYHPEEAQRRKDRRGQALIFVPERSWYFGGNGRFLPPHLAHLAAYGQGHRVNGVRDGDAERLEAWLLTEGPPGRHGEPRDGWALPGSSSCVSPPTRPLARPPRSPPC